MRPETSPSSSDAIDSTTPLSSPLFPPPLSALIEQSKREPLRAREKTLRDAFEHNLIDVDEFIRWMERDFGE